MPAHARATAVLTLEQALADWAFFLATDMYIIKYGPAALTYRAMQRALIHKARHACTVLSLRVRVIPASDALAARDV